MIDRSTMDSFEISWMIMPGNLPPLPETAMAHIRHDCQQSRLLQGTSHDSLVTGQYFLPVFLPTLEILSHIFPIPSDDIYTLRLNNSGVWAV